ncbi:MAG: hypothetical protein J2O44_06685, partial [Porphyrobacter sp.]|nr:hypothetical protein [Porphyrobacter sp.]
MPVVPAAAASLPKAAQGPSAYDAAAANVNQSAGPGRAWSGDRVYPGDVLPGDDRDDDASGSYDRQDYSYRAPAREYYAAPYDRQGYDYRPTERAMGL